VWPKNSIALRSYRMTPKDFVAHHLSVLLSLCIICQLLQDDLGIVNGLPSNPMPSRVDLNDSGQYAAAYTIGPDPASALRISRS